MTWPFDPLQPLRYSMIMADPPWSFANWSAKGHGKSAHAHYDCMSLDDLAALPVRDLATRDALLWMWATAPMLPQALATMEAWGFEYVTMGTWAKQSRTGNAWAFGTGYVMRSASEPFLIGKIGRPKTTRSTRNLIVAPVREHSRKPDEAYRAAEDLIPGAARCELFARERRPGWDVWGNEAGRFGAAA